MTTVTTINYYDTLVIILPLGHLSQYARVYGLLLCITVFESTCIKFFPWLVTDFSKSSGGYPTPFLFRICGYSKIVQSLVSTLVQVVILANSNSDTSQCGTIIIIAISSSIIVLVMTLFEIVSQSKSLSTVSSTSGNDSSTINDTDTELSSNIHLHRISNAANPMVKEEG